MICIVGSTLSYPCSASHYNPTTRGAGLPNRAKLPSSRAAAAAAGTQRKYDVSKWLLSNLRGGQSADPNNYPNYDAGMDPMYDNLPPPVTSNEGDPFQETVQQRVDNWRNTQREMHANLTPEQQLNPRDEKGRLKLLVSVSKGSRAIVFFIMMWRDVFLYEVADQSLKGGIRLLFVVPIMVLFVANLVGILASLSSTSHQAKKRLKAILNLDKMAECFLLVWYFIRLTVAPSRYVPREVFIGNTLHSVFFFIQCQTVTRLTWDEVPTKAEVPPMTEEMAFSEENFYGQEQLYTQQQQSPNDLYASGYSQPTNRSSY